jgi:hypothetical protein
MGRLSRLMVLTQGQTMALSGADLKPVRTVCRVRD